MVSLVVYSAPLPFGRGIRSVWVSVVKNISVVSVRYIVVAGAMWR